MQNGKGKHHYGYDGAEEKTPLCIPVKKILEGTEPPAEAQAEPEKAPDVNEKDSIHNFAGGHGTARFTVSVRPLPAECGD